MESECSTGLHCDLIWGDRHLDVEASCSSPALASFLAKQDQAAGCDCARPLPLTGDGPCHSNEPGRNAASSVVDVTPASNTAGKPAPDCTSLSSSFISVTVLVMAASVAISTAHIRLTPMKNFVRPLCQLTFTWYMRQFVGIVCELGICDLRVQMWPRTMAPQQALMQRVQVRKHKRRRLLLSAMELDQPSTI